MSVHCGHVFQALTVIGFFFQVYNKLAEGPGVARGKKKFEEKKFRKKKISKIFFLGFFCLCHPPATP